MILLFNEANRSGVGAKNFQMLEPELDPKNSDARSCRWNQKIEFRLHSRVINCPRAAAFVYLVWYTFTRNINSMV